MRKYIKFILILTASMLLSSATPSLSFAYQFEDYAWGAPKDKVIQQIRSKNKKIDDFNNSDKVSFSDKIFDVECAVAFKFTPKTNLLYGISIAWTKNIGERIKEDLIKKHGQPVQADKSADDYIWGLYDDSPLMLNYSLGQMTLSYGNVKLQKQAITEQLEIDSKV
jgi:hypothetical protein